MSDAVLNGKLPEQTRHAKPKPNKQSGHLVALVSHFYSTVQPLISVIMPVRGPDQFLGDAINSILLQSYTDFELLLITYPDSASWIGLYAQRDKRIKVLQRKRPGVVAAANLGIDAAQGQYIARMDADDISLPGRLEQQLDFLTRNPDIAIAGGRVALFDGQNELKTGNRRYQDWLNSLVSNEAIGNSLFIESPLPNPTLFAQTTVFRQLGGYKNCEWAEDYDLLLRAQLAGLSMGKPAPVLLRWRDHRDRLTRTDERYSRLNFIRAKAWALSRSLAQNRSVIICGTGRNAVRLHDAFGEFGVNVVCFVEQNAAPKRTSRRHLPVITYTELAEKRGTALVVTAVTAYGAREQLRCWFNTRRWSELDDYVIAG